MYTFKPKTLNKIQKGDAKKCWEIIKDEVASHILGKNMIPVPYLHEAERYDLNAIVLLKKRNVVEKICRLKKKGLAVNILQEIIRSDISSGESLQFTQPVKVNSRYHQQTAIFGFSGSKTVLLQLQSLSLYELHTPNNGNVMIDLTPYILDFETRTVYLITKVVYAEEVRLRFIVDHALDEYRIKQRVPIGFQLTKCRIHYTTIIGRCEPIEIAPSFRWLEFNKTKIHRTLLVDRENRGGGDDGQRRHGPRNVTYRSIYRHLNDDTDSDNVEEN